MTEVEKCLECLREGINKVEAGYYHPRRADGTNPTRERIFCYELYHQMRLGDDEIGHMIHGEPDKSGNEIFKEDQVDPDFIFHESGNMGNNILVVEVKLKLDSTEVIKDLGKLCKFVSNYSYCGGLFVIINFSWEELKSKMDSHVIEAECSKDLIRIYCKKSADADLEKHTLAELMS